MAAEQRPVLTATCLCKAIHIEISQYPVSCYLCHCFECRKSTGTLFATQTVFPREAIKIVRGEDKLGKYSDYGRDGDSYHAFCSKCGSPMMCGVQNDKMAIVRLGLIDAEDDERMQRIMDGLGEGGEAQKDGKSLFEPTDEIFCKRKIAWAKDWKVEGAKQWREMDG